MSIKGTAAIFLKNLSLLQNHHFERSLFTFRGLASLILTLLENDRSAVFEAAIYFASDNSDNNDDMI